MGHKLHGLLGAHRVGKSTLAESVACGIWDEYLPIRISTLQAEIGYDSSKQDYSWEERKVIQTHLLIRFKEILKGLDHRIHPQAVLRKEREIVTDRTPLDLIGYAMWSFPKEPTSADQFWMDQYVIRCIQLTDQYYEDVTLIQPGIPLVESETSAAADEEMIETFNQCYLSLLLNPYLKVKTTIIPRECVNLTDRIRILIGLTDV